jgi:hypothetical protein
LFGLKVGDKFSDDGHLPTIGLSDGDARSIPLCAPYSLEVVGYDGSARRVTKSQERIMKAEPPTANPPTPAASDPKQEYEKVKLLFDYTKFHINLYTVIGASVVALGNLEATVHSLEIWRLPMWISVGLIACAGLAGGIIASSLPECDTLDDFLGNPAGFWNFRPCSGRRWTQIEHTSFWLGLAFGVAAFARIHSA